LAQPLPISISITKVMGGRFALKWDNFQRNIESTFGEVKLSQDFSDVTLVGEDFELEAHRLILSAGSLVFQQVLKKAKHPHPMIYLNGTKKVEIEAVLSFLYLGEVTICQENLEQFLLTAKELKIRGVMEDETEGLLDNSKEDPKDSKEVAMQEIGEVQHSKAGRKSLIHSHFSTSTETEAFCNLCGKHIAMKCGSTSGLWRHMEKKHEEVAIKPPDRTFDLKVNDFEPDLEDSKLWNVNKSNADESAEDGNESELTEKQENGKTDGNEVTMQKQERPSRSKVWAHFKRLSQDTAICKSCERLYKTSGGSTTGLWKHMSFVHKDVDCEKDI